MNAPAIDIDALADEIRRVGRWHSLGAGALAEALAPYISAIAQPSAGAAAVGYANAHEINGTNDGFLVIRTIKKTAIGDGFFTVPIYTTPQPDARDAISLIAAERQRQITAEGWSPEHDDEHGNGELAWAAASYVERAARTDEARENWPNPEASWPWDKSWWKPGDRTRELVKAGALIVAEIERLQRAAIAGRQQEPT